MTVTAFTLSVSSLMLRLNLTTDIHTRLMCNFEQKYDGTSNYFTIVKKTKKH